MRLAHPAAYQTALLAAQNVIATLLHEPFGRARGATDAHGFCPVKPAHVNLFGTLHLITMWVYLQAFVKQHLAIRAFPPGHKQHHVVACGKVGDVGHAIGHLTADGVEALEGGVGRDMGLNVVDDVMELVQALCGLRLKVNALVEV